ncbi:hypothetical protein BS50DRAFT_235889 [Corynespora cassiicola Philippines]|uniref:Uncharacterized protein n=1 Tax=Corynespora cassiicola Philippines TaxID=1448308 RepID=A0A2T2P297_CORCC|nr:hypothetical protein BS50DRAFT_235889 [Corynespora cassiicola Philippines]
MTTAGAVGAVVAMVTATDIVWVLALATFRITLTLSTWYNLSCSKLSNRLLKQVRVLSSPCFHDWKLVSFLTAVANGALIVLAFSRNTCRSCKEKKTGEANCVVFRKIPKPI